MRWWIRVHRLTTATFLLVFIGVIAAVFGDSGLPIVSGADSSSVPVVALAPALSSAVVVAALSPPWAALASTFARSVGWLTAGWLAVGGAVIVVVLLPSVGGDKTAFTDGDLLRNVAVFMAVAAIGGALLGLQLCWLLPAVLSVASFIPSAGQARHWWTVAVWTGTTTRHGCLALAVAMIATVPLVVGRERGRAE
jgi:hypothetical protein